MLHESFPMHTVETGRQLRSLSRDAKAMGKRVGFVPTMGALHAGHRSLIEASAAGCGFTAVSIFVNPTQFDRPDDLAAYPRTLDEDLALCRDAGADAVFLPDAGELYPGGFSTTVRVAGPALPLEGEHRPGHFDGVATVVLKLLNCAEPDAAYFGEKDFQQLAVVRRMVRDLDLPVEVVGRPTVREPDGLALSSRNARLSAGDRGRAVELSRTLRDARDRLCGSDGGDDAGMDADALERTMRDRLTDAGFTVDYAVLRDADSLAPVTGTTTDRVLLAAAWLGGVRLIDNVRVEPNAPAGRG